MVNRTFVSLVPRIAPSVPGCPQPTIVQHIRDAAIRVCERTLSWRHMQPVYALSPGVHEYAYQCPANTRVHAILMAAVNGVNLDVLTFDAAVQLYPQWADLYSGLTPEEVWGQIDPQGFNTNPFNDDVFNGSTGAYELPAEATADGSDPRVITQVSHDKFVVLPAPDATKPYLLRMVYALKPTRDASGMRDVMFDELEDMIFHNALQHLLTIPNSNWSDKELAAYHAKQFLAQSTERRARANLGNQRGVLTARMVPFG